MINSACEFFYSVLYSFFDVCVPVKYSHEFTNPPWITSYIKADIKRKYHYFKMSKQFPHSSYFNDKFKYFRTKIKNEIKHSYDNYV